jgi:hypothetical protein
LLGLLFEIVNGGNVSLKRWVASKLHGVITGRIVLFFYPVTVTQNMEMLVCKLRTEVDFFTFLARLPVTLRLSGALFY